jgi:glucosamine 6-phosphate synthetase-like amidotransferase/phosphosugar isomerase protein
VPARLPAWRSTTSAGEPVQREMKRISSEVEDADLGDFEHYMLKEIYEQPHALAATFAKAAAGEVEEAVFGEARRQPLRKPTRYRSSPVEPVTTPDSWPATGSRTLPVFPAR